MTPDAQEAFDRELRKAMETLGIDDPEATVNTRQAAKVLEHISRNAILHAANKGRIRIARPGRRGGVHNRVPTLLKLKDVVLYKISKWETLHHRFDEIIGHYGEGQIVCPTRGKHPIDTTGPEGGG